MANISREDKSNIIEGILQSYLVEEIEAYARVLSQRNHQIAVLQQRMDALEAELLAAETAQITVTIGGRSYLMQRNAMGEYQEVIDLTAYERLRPQRMRRVRRRLENEFMTPQSTSGSDIEDAQNIEVP